MAPEAHRRVKRKMLPLKYSNSSLDLINITLRCTRPLHFSPLKKYLKTIYRKKKTPSDLPQYRYSSLL